ncbi:BZ3500_MvSof-1268-A1-R1_Chr6-3g08922 [Microbotryum saponariae]|uniref:BZ3500_MvSof-1268-A1-R1_Chr6-3g08922 protein n=1 Tax=Microbotryum saponariae TaxID=289078 RepID=A0A2X0MPK6_9BASI|nr:BZ3500_MvSof-1268-A1-R1_Chr6-3g08922 [Microbotryum saponariae]
MPRASTSRHPLDLPERHDHDPVQLRLEQLFPSADPAYLAQVIEHHRPQPRTDPAAATLGRPRRRLGAGLASNSSASYGDGGAGDDHEDEHKALINQVYHKLVEINHHEYPRCVRRPVNDHDALPPASILRHDQVQKRWRQQQVTLSGSENGSRSRSRSRTSSGSRKQKHLPVLPPHTLALDRTLMMNQAMYVGAVCSSVASRSAHPLPVPAPPRIRLHTLFPTTPISDLRDVVAMQPHSHLFLATEELLLRQRSPIKAKSTMPAFNWHTFFTFTPNENRTRGAKPAPPVPTLTRDDLLRSPRHVSHLVDHLQRMYPNVPTSSIRSLVAEGGSYSTIQEAVLNWRQRQSKLKAFFNDLFSAPPARPLSFHASAALVTDPPELVEELAQVTRKEQTLLQRRDEDLARQLNADWTPQVDRFECECCFSDDVTFEEIVPCSTGRHFVCRTCLIRIVQEMVYGGTVAKPTIQCMSIGDCKEMMERDRVDLVLPSAVKKAWDHRLAQNEIEAWAGTSEGGRRPALVRCSFCPYVEEVVEASLWGRFFPLLVRDFPASPLTVLSDLAFTLFNLCLLPLLYFSTIYVMLLNPDPFAPYFANVNANANDINALADNDPAPQAVHRHPLPRPNRYFRTGARFLAAQARTQLLRSSRSNSTTLFRCRNTPNSLPPLPSAVTSKQLERSQNYYPNPDDPEWCGRTSCRLCHQVVPSEGMHACNQDREESLRLAMETAMSEAVKRVCTRCGVAFTKESGCNKMTCPRCGANSCYVCRQTIGDESYAHFCQHFRPLRKFSPSRHKEIREIETFPSSPLAGRPCNECRKCSLWDTSSDTDVAAKAAERGSFYAVSRIGKPPQPLTLHFLFVSCFPPARQAWLKDQPSSEHALLRPTVVGPSVELQDPTQRVVAIGPPKQRYEKFELLPFDFLCDVCERVFAKGL